MRDGAAPGRVYAPVPVAAATTLLWIQGAIWAALGSLDVAFCPEKTPLNDLLITVFLALPPCRRHSGYCCPIRAASGSAPRPSPSNGS
jgi:hypothetical protein